jgi:hypothetical protein
MRLNRIELDLGVLDLARLDDELAERIEVGLRQALATRQHTEHRAESPERSALELVEMFARTGHLPWWAGRSVPTIVTSQLHVLAQQTPLALARMIDRCERSHLERLAQHVDTAVLDAIVCTIFAGHDALPEICSRVVIAIERASTPARARADVLSWLGRVHSERSRASAAMPAIDATLTIGRAHAAASGDAEAAIVATLRDSTHHVPSAGGWLPTAAHPPAALLPVAARTSAQPRFRSSTALKGGSASRSSPPVQREPDDRRGAELSRLDGVYVEDAGLVLLWPFLGRFFTRTRLLDGHNAFVDDEAGMQAIALLAQVALGDWQAPEFCLSISKLLCGMTPDALLAREQRPDAEQLEECSLLLAAVVDHVPALHGQSIESVRGLFLQRRGKLSVRNESWLLQVERASEDAAISLLTWPVQWIQLPWMPAALHVEW